MCSTVSHTAARAVRLTNTERRADSSKGLEEGSLTMRNEGHSRLVVVLWWSHLIGYCTFNCLFVSHHNSARSHVIVFYETNKVCVGGGGFSAG